jgi:hypothetical protein
MVFKNPAFIISMEKIWDFAEIPARFYIFYVLLSRKKPKECVRSLFFFIKQIISY